LKTKLSLWGRAVGVTVATVYFLTNVALAYSPEKNLWSERRRLNEKKSAGAQDNLLLAALPVASSSAALFQPLPASSRITSALSDDLAKTLPLSLTAGHAKLFNALQPTHGTIRKVWMPAHNAGERVVVHIQDVHQNENAQRHIGGVVESLMKAGQAGVVGLEGSSTPINVQAYHDFKDREVIRLTADYLLKENKITGPIHAAMTTPAPLAPMLGVDDPTHYNANVDAYRQSAPKVDIYKKAWAAKKLSLEGEKKAVFSSELLAFDSRMQSYQKRGTSLAEYVKALSPVKDQGNVGLLAQAFEMEKGLDFSRVEADRKEMIDVLVKTLTQDQINHLIQESTAYRLGEVRYGEFYVYLKDLCRGAKIDLARFPHMDAYIRYVLVSDRIDAEKLLTELAALEKYRYGVLAKTSEERALIHRSRALELAGRLLTFELSPEEWAEYRDLNAGATLGLDMVSFESFYKEAHARDESLSANILKAMDDGHLKTAVLVTGGYHTGGVSEQLVKAGVTVVTFTPRIETINTENGSAYLSIFTQEKTPLEKLFAGEKLFLGGDAFSKATQQMAPVVAAGAAAAQENGSSAVAENTYRELGGLARRFSANIKNRVVTVQVWARKVGEAVQLIVQRTSEGTLSVQQTVVVALSIATIAAAVLSVVSFAFGAISGSMVSLSASVPGVSAFSALSSALVALVTGQAENVLVGMGLVAIPKISAEAIIKFVMAIFILTFDARKVPLLFRKKAPLPLSLPLENRPLSMAAHDNAGSAQVVSPMPSDLARNSVNSVRGLPNQDRKDLLKSLSNEIGNYKRIRRLVAWANGHLRNVYSKNPYLGGSGVRSSFEYDGLFLYLILNDLNQVNVGPNGMNLVNNDDDDHLWFYQSSPQNPTTPTDSFENNYFNLEKCFEFINQNGAGLQVRGILELWTGEGVLSRIALISRMKLLPDEETRILYGKLLKILENKMPNVIENAISAIEGYSWTGGWNDGLDTNTGRKEELFKAIEILWTIRNFPFSNRANIDQYTKKLDQSLEKCFTQIRSFPQTHSDWDEIILYFAIDLLSDDGSWGKNLPENLKASEPSDQSGIVLDDENKRLRFKLAVESMFGDVIDEMNKEDYDSANLLIGFFVLTELEEANVVVLGMSERDQDFLSNTKNPTVKNFIGSKIMDNVTPVDSGSFIEDEIITIGTGCHFGNDIERFDHWKDGKALEHLQMHLSKVNEKLSSVLSSFDQADPIEAEVERGLRLWWALIHYPSVDDVREKNPEFKLLMNEIESRLREKGPIIIGLMNEGKLPLRLEVIFYYRELIKYDQMKERLALFSDSSSSAPLPNSLLFLLTGKNVARGAGIDGLVLTGLGMGLALFYGPVLALSGMALFVLPFFAGVHVYARTRKNPGMSWGKMFSVFTQSYLLALPYLLTVAVPFLDFNHGMEALLMAVPAAFHMMADAFVMGRKDAEALGELLSQDPAVRLRALMGTPERTTDVFDPSIRTIERMASAQQHTVLGFVYRVSFRYFASDSAKGVINKGLADNGGSLFQALFQGRVFARSSDETPTATLTGMVINREGMNDLSALLETAKVANANRTVKQYFAFTPGEGVTAQELSDIVAADHPIARVVEAEEPQLLVDGVYGAMNSLGLDAERTGVVMLSVPSYNGAENILKGLWANYHNAGNVDSAVKLAIVEAILEALLNHFYLTPAQLMNIYKAEQLAKTFA
jgi:hypothetical protein